jgi:hypothetical protein
MFASLNRSLASCVLAVLFAAPLPAFARVILNTIDASAIVTDAGRHLIVTGPLACTAGERAFLLVTVTQRSTGALAQGSTLINCTGETGQWEVHATTQGREAFQTGTATAVASARTMIRGETTDSHQWLVAIALVEAQ